MQAIVKVWVAGGVSSGYGEEFLKLEPSLLFRIKHLATGIRSFLVCGTVPFGVVETVASVPQHTEQP